MISSLEKYKNRDLEYLRFLPNHCFLYFSCEEITDSIHQRPKMTNMKEKFSNSDFLQIKNPPNPFTDDEIPFAQSSDQKLSEIAPNRTDTFFSKPFEKCEHFEQFSFSCHFVVSRWILLGVGDLISLVEFFRFLFLVFQCYHTVANLLQSLLYCTRVASSYPFLSEGQL